eukprot:3904456-Rhodomonas_salina.1
MATLRNDNMTLETREGSLKASRPQMDYRIGVNDVLASVSAIERTSMRNVFESQESSKNEGESSDEGGELSRTDGEDKANPFCALDTVATTDAAREAG